MINELIKLATHLDKRGHYREANYLDSVIRKFAGPCSVDQLVLMINFDMGEAELGSAWSSQAADARCLIEAGMSGDADFITLVGGVSAVGGRDRNIELMFERKDAALKYLLELGASGPLPGGMVGQYDFKAISNKINPDWEFETLKPGQVMPNGVKVPEVGDPNYERFFKQYQFVKVVISTPSVAPDFARLAREFQDATDGPGTTEEDVYNILKELRHAKDFHAWNQKLREVTGRTFYQIACDQTQVPWVLTGKVTMGPSELGGDDTVNMWLNQNGLAELTC